MKNILSAASGVSQFGNGIPLITKVGDIMEAQERGSEFLEIRLSQKNIVHV
ncbi:hypothetical protein [Fimbriiglobus ruber]|uniref:Uncharacterized protein n=1 Tax=Fimbriiglobus ruber TaxID=1908690 RepID=A0A225DM57_9BACT|nr:hypothetical protein [Fimbriiglobus ruber]OWK38566.1 hypothetical protein FRUB_07686 [Fimbriiglobus ruber]